MHSWYIASSKRYIWYLYKGKVSYNSQHLKRFQWEPVSTHWAISKPDWWDWAKSMPPQKTNINKGCSNTELSYIVKETLCYVWPQTTCESVCTCQGCAGKRSWPYFISNRNIKDRIAWKWFGLGIWVLIQQSLAFSILSSANLYQVKIYDYVSYGRKLLIRPRMSKRCFCDGIQTGIAELQGSIQL